MVKREENVFVEEKEEDHHSMDARTSVKEDYPQNNNAPIKKFVNTAVLIILVILVLLAMFSFFFNMQGAIAALINPKYQSLVQALFSLMVLVIGIYTIKRFLYNKNE